MRENASLLNNGISHLDIIEWHKITGSKVRKLFQPIKIEKWQLIRF